MKIKDRIKDFRRVPASELIPNPKNWRVHPEAQQNALRGVLAEIGIADAVLARETEDGLQIIDGHLRADIDPTVKWPVLVLDVTSDEADKLLATHDPIGDMADTDPEALQALLAEIETESEAVGELLDILAQPKYATESISLSLLKDHPQNYLKHPDDQLQHLVESIKEHGIYQNIVVAQDNTILSGHGLVEAAKRLDHATVPVIRLDIDPSSPKALKVLTGDNEIGKMAEVDDRLLTETLKKIKETDPEGLLGTGYDEKILANLAMVTRPQSEIENFDAAAEWLGMPDFEENEEPYRLIIRFSKEEAMAKFTEETGILITKKLDKSWSCEYEKESRDDLRSVKIDAS